MNEPEKPECDLRVSRARALERQTGLGPEALDPDDTLLSVSPNQAPAFLSREPSLLRPLLVLVSFRRTTIHAFYKGTRTTS